jgi:DNA polymerase IV
MSQPARRVAHLDMDAFFASVELLRHPELRGEPVVIGGSRDAAGARHGRLRHLREYVGRGVVTTATYEARRFGVHSAMGLMRAAQLCPDAVLLPTDFEEYRRYSRSFKAVIARFSSQIEDRGVDEVYIDFTQAPDGQSEGGRTLAACIQAAIREATGLTCSIGVAPNKLLAKMASEFHKPNGIAIVYESELAEKIWPLPCRRISGIGPKAGERLAQLGIRTIGELARCELAWLAQHFGRHHGTWMHAAAWGQDARPLVTHSEPVSISRESTFERDLHAIYDRGELRTLLTGLCQRVAQDLQRDGYAAKTIGVKLRYHDFRRVTREQTIEVHTNDAVLIRRIAAQCLRRVPLEQRVRLLGVKVSGLVRSSAITDGSRGQPDHLVGLPLFEPPSGAGATD